MTRKILKGNLQESLYTWPDQSKIHDGQASPPQVTKQTLYGENEVTYMSDKVCVLCSSVLALASCCVNR